MRTVSSYALLGALGELEDPPESHCNNVPRHPILYTFHVTLDAFDINLHVQ
jgi:hypothetical protein